MEAPLITALNKHHNRYTELLPTWLTIKDLEEGAYKVLREPGKYIFRRPGESDELYLLRLRKTAYTPLINDSIRQFSSKVVYSNASIVGLVSPVWADWNEKNDSLLQMYYLLRSALYYGSAYIGVLPTVSTNSSYIASQSLPQIRLYEPTTVVNWGRGWFITKEQKGVQDDPLDPLERIETFWTVWATTNTKIFKSIDGQPPVLIQEWSHDGCLMTPLLLPTELWTGNNVYSKQLQYMQIESSWSDVGSMMHLQRTYNPPSGDSYDPRLMQLQSMKFDNAHVALGDFTFNESTGMTLNALTNQLETIESQIRSLVNIQYATTSKRGNPYQSSDSKVADNKMASSVLSVYGQLTGKAYSNVLNTVARLLGLNDVISIVGMNNYDGNDTTTLLQEVDNLLKIKGDVSPEAYANWISKLEESLKK